VHRAWPILLLGLVACEARPSQPPPPEPRATPVAAASATAANEGAAVDEGDAAGIHYLLRYSAGAQRDETLPMIVAIHGLGDRPEHFAPLVGDFEKKARFVIPRGLEAHGRGYSWFPIRVGGIDPERVAVVLRTSAERVAAMLEQLPSQHPTRGKPIITGFSQGGMLSFAVAVEHPRLIAKAVPLAGWLPPPLWPAKAPAGTPAIVALHGDADSVLPVEPTRDAVGALRRAGYDANLHEYPGVSHTLSPAMRRDLFRELASAIAAPP
jgi:phospholipase/carboxylesterase